MAMQSDIRQSTAFKAVEDFYTALFAPGVGHVYSADDCAPTADGRRAYFNGQAFHGALADGPSERLYEIDLQTGALNDLFGRASRMARPCPNGSRLACMVSNASGEELLSVFAADARPMLTRQIEGLVEQLEWSPDGRRLLMVVAGLGADLAGYQGGLATKAAAQGPAWLPEVRTGQEGHLWRRLWVLDVESSNLSRVSRAETNVWEATWWGPAHIAAVCSDDHSEGTWYASSLRRIALDDGAEEIVYRPRDQIGLATGSPDGRRLAFVEALCSDRGIICGQAMVIGADGAARPIPTGEVEVSSLAWRDDDVLHYAGQAAFDTVIGDYRLADGQASELWRSSGLTCGAWYPSAKPLPGGRSLVVAEAYDQAPRVAIIEAGTPRTVRSLAAPAAAEAMTGRGTMGPAVWTAPDGLEIHGWLVTPDDAKGPAPLVLDIHGGPIWANRGRWMGRGRAAPLLAALGCAVLYPNPRGSSTRGQDFARLVRGDMGGADTGDLLSAVDHLVASGLADPERLACTGTSYGGYMSAWLVTQDTRFAAAAPISPVTDWFSQHRTSQIPHFDLAFLDGSSSRTDGLFFSRSPVMFADRVTTPCLVMAGALDKNTPPTQALEFHQSLCEAGAKSVLVTYPNDGHSLRGYPAYLDSAARILSWFGEHLRLQAAP